MDARNELKGKRGLVRLLNATRYSLAGYKAAWQDEEAFRQICLLAVIGLPLACRLGRLRFGTIIGRCGQGNLWLRPTGSIFVLRGKVEGHLRYRTGLPPYSFPGITAHPVTGPFGHPYRAL